MKKIKYLIILTFLLLLGGSYKYKVDYKEYNIDLDKNYMEGLKIPKISGASCDNPQIMSKNINIIDGERIYVGQSKELSGSFTIQCRTSNGSGGYSYYSTTRSAVFTSSNSSIVEVDSNYIAHGISAGYTSIKVYPSGFQSLSIYVDVNVGTSISSLYIGGNGEVVKVGKNLVFSYYVSPSNDSVASHEWWSNNESIATVNQNGKVTGQSVGQTRIWVKVCDSFDNCLFESQSVMVISNLSSVSIGDHPSSLAVGNTANLTFSVNPSGAYYKNPSWSSTNTGVARINSSGYLEAVAVGTTTIKLSVGNGNGESFEDSFVLNVTSNLTGVTINSSSNIFTVGESRTLGFTTNPSNGYYSAKEWSSTNTNVASIDQSGRVYANSVGNSTILLKLNKGDGTYVQASYNITVNPAISDVTINGTFDTLRIGESRKVSYSITGSGSYSYTWSSSNTNVATIDNNGNITANAVGGATITLNIVPNSGDPIQKSFGFNVLSNLVDVSISPNIESLNVDSSRELSLILTPSNGYYYSKSWSTSDANVAYVDTNDILHTRNIGHAQITLTINKNDGTSNIVKTFNINVTPVKAEYVYITPNNVAINIGSSMNFTANIYPVNTTDKTVTWSSKNSSIASVDNYGHVITRGVGTTQICAKHKDLYSESCTSLTVNPIYAESINLGISSSVVLENGQSLNIPYTINPGNVTNTNHYISTYDSSIIRVIDNHTVRAVGTGRCFIKVHSGDERVVRQIEIYVPNSAQAIYLYDTTVDVGSDVNIGFSVYPQDAEIGSLTWTSNQNSVATVTQDGVVHGVKAGTARITVTGSNGVGGSVDVKVVPKATRVSMSSHSNIMKVNEEIELSYTVTPSNATNYQPIWVSSDNEVLSVKNGVVKALKAGTATITLKNPDNSVSTTSTITVINPIDYVVARDGDIELGLGETKKIEYDILPDDATPRTFTWKSSNPGVATVSNDGTITVVGTGKSVISVVTEDGDEFEVTTVRIGNVQDEIEEPDGNAGEDENGNGTTDNPKTGLTISIICVIIFMIGYVLFRMSSKKFNKIRRI